MQKLTVPFVNFGIQTQTIKDELLRSVDHVLSSGNYILGPETTSFEREFANYCGVEFGVGLANGTCALHLVLKGLGLSEGDEVITTSNSFIASASSIALTGAKPVFVDIAEDLNIDPNKLESAITSKTKVIMVVHLTGRVAKMPQILEIAKKYNLFVLEDAAQAIGSKLNNQSAGSFGDAATFSLHPLKNLHAFGDGGMLVTNRRDIFERMVKSRNHGLKNRNECEFWSFNCRLDEIQAAMLRVQLKYLPTWLEQRRQLAFRYNKLLAPYVDVPVEQPGEYHTYQTYMIQADRRDELLKFLNGNNVEARVHYPIAIHQQEAAKSLGHTDRDLPITAKMSQRIMSLPLYPSLTEEQQEYIAQLIQKFYQ